MPALQSFQCRGPYWNGVSIVNARPAGKPPVWDLTRRAEREAFLNRTIAKGALE